MRQSAKTTEQTLKPYVIALVAKNRCPVFEDPEFAGFITNHAEYVCGLFDARVSQIEARRDHIRIVVNIPASFDPRELVRNIKPQTSREVHFTPEMEEKALKAYGVRTPLWHPSFYLFPSEESSDEKIDKYVSSRRPCRKLRTNG